MTTRTSTDARRPRGDLAAGITFAVLAALFCAIYAVFLISFRGEFLIVVRGMWILPVFLVLLVGGAVATLVAGKAGAAFPNALPGPRASRAWVICWSAWNLLTIVPVLLVGRVLSLGALGSIPLALIAVLALPFVGYAAMAAMGSIRSLVRLVGRPDSARLLQGAAVTGFAFLFAFASFGVVAATWHPAWTDGVQHQALFSPGDERGRAYRIPALAVLPGDVVLAFAESRVDAMSDLLDINIVMRRSTDGGRTWGPLTTVVDIGRHTVSSPTPVFDRGTGTLWLPYCVDYGAMYLISSTDQGRTWSAPRDVTAEVGLAHGLFTHSGPGNGIALSTGRLVIPATIDAPRVVYSDDHGVSWKLGAPIGRGEEAQVFEAVDGSVYANLRAGLGRDRIMARTTDGGATWGAWYYVTGLRDSDTQASVARFSTARTGARNRVLFSNPGAGYRGSMTLQLSYDEGATWSVTRLLSSGAAGYSDLGVLSDGTILLLFESGRFDLRESITLARVDLGWLTGGNDRAP